MTVLVKNEEKVLEKHLKFHKAMGVDGFIITNHNSSDKTSAIINKYYKLGWVKEVINETCPEHRQADFVDRMIIIARDKYKADWIINADADELWYSNGGNIKNLLSKVTQNVVKVNVYNVIPIDEDDIFMNDHVIIGRPDSHFALPPFSLYEPQIPKVIHRALGYRKITNGNHSVAMSRKSTLFPDDICIFHYSLRGVEHFESKMINGGETVKKLREENKTIANHWVYFYDLLNQSNVDVTAEYQKVIGLNHLEEFKSQGIVIKDSRAKKIILELD
jgi:hypothetical protein